MKRALVALLLALAVLAAVVAVRTARFQLSAHGVQAVALPPVDAEAVAARLGQAIRIPTVSFHEEEAFDWPAFERFAAFLQSTYPTLHRTLARERVGRASWLHRWTGSDASLQPVVLMAHQDVVPVQPGTEPDWEQPPFSGAIADGKVWGRGALDDKGSLIALCEAVEGLARAGFRPTRTLLVSFGHDEEVGGTGGAAQVVALLRERGITPELVVDEGGAITLPGLIPGLDQPVALVGIAEKGYVSFALSVTAEGGHSSRPPPHSGVGLLATAVHRLERNPFPLSLEGPARQLLLSVGPAMRLPLRAALANLWLSEPLVVRRLASLSVGNAMLRTTTAATMFQGSPQDNVLPVHARAVVNFRIRPDETVESVKEHVRRTIDDERIAISQYGAVADDPSPVADTASWSYRTLERTLHEVFPEALVAPNLVIGGTDARYFSALTPNVYRFLPFRLSEQDLARAHGTNERLEVADLARAVGFYDRLIRNATGSPATP